MKITTIGIDLAKEIFQIHGVDKHGKIVLRKQLRRNKMTKLNPVEIKYLHISTGWNDRSVNIVKFIT